MAFLTHKTTLLLSGGEYRLLRMQSDLTRKTMGDLIRTAIRKVYGRAKSGGARKAWEELFRSEAPVADVQTLKYESLKGRLLP